MTKFTIPPCILSFIHSFINKHINFKHNECQDELFLLDICIGTWACAHQMKALAKTDVFGHQDFENQTKNEGVMAVTMKIS